MANIVFVAGSGHGGWYFDPIVALLHEAGHKTFQPSLSGLADSEEIPAFINLDTHIDDVLQFIEAEQIDTVVLVAHSYGGMVTTGVAARTEAKVSHLIYLDAMVPLPGQRQWELMDADTQNMLISGLHDGLYLYPSDEFLAYRPRVRPHPFATMMQPIDYPRQALDGVSKTFVLAEKYFGIDGMRSPFEAFYNKYREDPEWQTHKLNSGHDLVVEVPELVVKVILEAVAHT